MALHHSFSDDYKDLSYTQEYDYLWTEERYSKFDENGVGVLSPSWWFRQEEEAADRQGVTSVNPLLVAFVVGVTFSALLLLAPLISPLPRPKLQNDPMCGIPTGGQVLKIVGYRHNMNFIFFRRSAGGIVKSDHTLCWRAKPSSTLSASRTALTK